MKGNLLPKGHFHFTSESVTCGHPDKLCDAISDAILDACLEQDPKSYVGCEAVAKSNMILIAGEITSNAKIEIEQIVRNKVKEIGYDDEKKGLNYATCDVIINVTRQSGDISQSVHENKKDEDLGAGDQGIMFGYASDETKELMPLSHILALQLSEQLTSVRQKGTVKWMRPDGKTQVTVEYKKEGGNVIPIRVHTVLISTQHDPDVDLAQIKKDLVEYVITPVVPKEYLDEQTNFILNPSGMFVVGGPEADAGLTGRKIIVDSYGGWGAHGGGAFSGKDPTKVDRSGAYSARWIAKSLVAAGLCKRCLIQISYSIGLKDPLSIFIENYGTLKEGLTDEDLLSIVLNNFDLKPYSMIKELDLRNQIYSKTSSGGHFGRDIFSWEKPKELKLSE